MSDKSDMKQERRRANRVEAYGNVPGQLDVDLDTDVIQLSPGGMMVDMELPLPVGSKHQFTLNIENERLDLNGVVRNCQPQNGSESSPRYHIGIEFRDLSEQQQALLTRYVEKQIQT